MFGAREALQARPPGRCRSAPRVSLLPNGGKMLLGTDICAVLTTLEALAGRRDRPELLDRHRRTCAMRSASSASTAPYRCPASPTPGCRCRARNGETIFPEQPGPLADALGEFVERYGVGHRRRLLRHHAGAHRARSQSAWRPKPSRPARQPRPPHLSSMIAATPLVRTRPDAGRRASQLTGLAQGQGAAAGRRLRRPRAGRRGPGARAARTCSTSASR